MYQFNKKAAIELSISTVVIIVLAMSMLVLGLVLVGNIFGGATDSVDNLNDKVKAQITDLFTEEGNKIAIKLGADKIAKVKQGTDDFSLAFGSQTKNGGSVITTDSFGTQVNNLWYELTLTNQDCGDDFATYLQDHKFDPPANPPTDRKTVIRYAFEEEQGANGFVKLIFNIPDGTEECTQRVKISTYTAKEAGDLIASATFRVKIISGGIFS